VDPNGLHNPLCELKKIIKIILNVEHAPSHDILDLATKWHATYVRTACLFSTVTRKALFSYAVHKPHLSLSLVQVTSVAVLCLWMLCPVITCTLTHEEPYMKLIGRERTIVLHTACSSSMLRANAHHRHFRMSLSSWLLSSSCHLVRELSAAVEGRTHYCAIVLFFRSAYLFPHLLAEDFVLMHLKTLIFTSLLRSLAVLVVCCLLWLLL
jgi:hypothetical protein